jgi:hypothetical protein
MDTVCGHTDLDVNDVADLVRLQVRGQRNHTVVAIPTREHVARAATKTPSVTHGCLLYAKDR